MLVLLTVMNTIKYNSKVWVKVLVNMLELLHIFHQDQDYYYIKECVKLDLIIYSTVILIHSTWIKKVIKQWGK